MLGNYLIGLREGLEAALVVSILLVYLQRTNRQALIRWVTYGVVSAVFASILVAFALEGVSSELEETAEPIFAGTVSFLAVIFVTWMIFWMKKSARTISTDLRNRLDEAAVAGGKIAVALMAFVAVIREGAETAIFYWAASQATGNSTVSLVGLTLGLGTAVVLGWAIYKSSASINLPKFFRVTGVLLVFVAAGVLSYGIHEFQEVGFLPGEDSVFLDLSSVLTEGSILSTLVAGVFNIKATTTTIQAIAYVTYIVLVLYVFLKPVDGRPFSRTKNTEPTLISK
jgi:high-affinity iron transporter